MGLPAQPVFYASAIIVKAVTDENGALFELDIEIAGGWVSTDPLARKVIDAIRAAAHPANTTGTEFDAVHAREGSPIRFLVDRASCVQNEWSFC